MPRWLMFFLFLVVVVSIYGGAHLYVYRRVVSWGAVSSGPLLAAIRLFAVAAVLSFFLGRWLLRHGPESWGRAVNFLASWWLGYFFYLFLAVLACHLLLTLLRLSGAAGFLEQQLGFALPRAALLLCFLLPLPVVIWGFQAARKPAEVTEVEIPLAHLPPALDGFTVVCFSDLHLGDTVNGKILRRLVRQINELQPDVVAIAGDLIDEDVGGLEEMLALLGELRAAHGVWAVTGNHEHYAGAEEVLRKAEKAGIRYLRGEKAVLPGGLIIYGFDDPLHGFPAPEFEKVIGPEAATAPTVLLFHQPRYYEQFARLGVGLTLSGHTHNGQLQPLGWLSGKLFYKHQSGLYKIGASWFYVTRGAGTWGPPLRVGSPPEIVRLRLRPPAPNAESK